MCARLRAISAAEESINNFCVFKFEYVVVVVVVLSNDVYQHLSNTCMTAMATSFASQENMQSLAAYSVFIPLFSTSGVMVAHA